MRAARSFLVTIPAIILSTIAFGSVSLVVSLFDSVGRQQIKVARSWARFLCFAAGVKIIVEGLEKISPDGAYVFTSNHLSYMDTPVVLSQIPVQFRFLAKEDLFKIPFMGTHLKSAGHIPVPRDDPRAAVRTLKLAAEKVHDQRISLLFFPEGGRSEDGELQEFKDGAAYVAIKSEAPLVPIALVGLRRILPMHGKVFSTGTVRLRIGEPILTAGLPMGDRGRITAESREQIVAMLESQPVQASR
ncbi:MAG: lysophospholipid acyltransferase family protein [Bryobacteraceae bacterium]